MSISLEYSKINEGVKNPFRWYNTKQKWNHLRQLCHGDCKYKLTTPELTMLPFQVYAENITPPFSIAWAIYDENEHLVMALNPDNLKIVKVGNYWYFISDGQYISGRQELECGYYYSQITIVDAAMKITDWYSEIFYVDKKANLFFESPELEGAVQCLPVLQWWNDCGMVGEIYYGSTGYTNLIYLDADAVITELEPKIIREGFEDGNKEFIAAWKKRITTYRIDIGLVPPYIVEALGEMVLHENIQLTLPYELGSAKLRNVSLEITHEKEGNGCYALASITFEMDDITVTDKCCDDDIDEQPCLNSDIMPQLIPAPVGCGTINTITWANISGQLCNDGTNTDQIESIYVNCFLNNGIYEVRVNVFSMSAGTLTVDFNGGILGVISSAGQYSYYITNTTGTKTLKLIPSGFAGCIDYGLYLLSTRFLLNNSWTYSDDGICFKTGSTGELEFITNMVIGKFYRITLEVEINYGSATFKCGSESLTFTQSGTYTFIMTGSNYVRLEADTIESQICVKSLTACEVQQ